LAQEKGNNYAQKETDHGNQRPHPLVEPRPRNRHATRRGEPPLPHPTPGNESTVRRRLFDLNPLGTDRLFDRATGGWPNIEVSETDKEVKVTAELPGLEDKDVQVELANGELAIRGEKQTETETNGVLTVTLPKSPTAQQKVKRIAVNGK
jgi:HSP20 family molecular chaperone IbpA